MKVFVCLKKTFRTVKKQVTFHEFIDCILENQKVEERTESELYYLFEFIRLCYRNKDLHNKQMYLNQWWEHVKRYDNKAQSMARIKFHVQFKLELYQ